MWPPAVLRFFQTTYADNARRSAASRRRWVGDAALYAKNLVLIPADRLLARRTTSARFPLVFLIGPPRSGTTLLYQLIARHVPVGYVSNRMARYFAVPIYGALRHRPTAEQRRDIRLESELGRTRGDASPHEFSYFWRYWCEIDAALDAERVRRIDWAGVRRELQGVAAAFAAPLVLKNLTFVDLNVATIAEKLPEARFVLLSRDLRFVAQSMLEARVTQYQSEQVWWSVRPPSLGEEVDARPPLEQVAAQARSIAEALDRSVADLGAERLLRLDYPALVSEPETSLRKVARFLGVPPDPDLRLPPLESSDRVRIPRERFAELERLLA